MIISQLTDIKYSTILKVSAPTILSSISSGIMSMLDVLVLAKYSTVAMTGVASASTWCYAFQCATIALLLITGSLVGHYNGACKYKFAGMPVWQMIWFSLSLFAISIPLSQVISPYCVPDRLHEYGIPYLKIVMGLSPVFCIKFAISSFLISRGKGFIVLLSSFIAIIVNTTLDILLILYCEYGTTGAAIGTIIAGLIEIIFLSCFFFSRNIRKKYGTLNCKLRLTKLLSYLKLGVFASIGNIIEQVIFSSIYYVLANSSHNNALTQTIASNVWRFLVCLGSGFEKGIIALTANLLEADLRYKVDTLFKRSVNIHLMFIILLFTFILCCPNLIIMNFVDINAISPETYQHLLNVLKLVATCSIFDGIVWIEAGIFVAGGDMNYMMPIIALCLSTFMAIPIFFIMNPSNLSVERMWMLYALADMSCGLILLHRYKTNKWIKIKV